MKKDHWGSSRYSLCMYATFITAAIFITALLVDGVVTIVTDKVVLGVAKEMASPMFIALGALWTTVMGIPKAAEHATRHLRGHENDGTE